MVAYTVLAPVIGALLAQYWEISMQLLKGAELGGSTVRSWK